MDPKLILELEAVFGQIKRRMNADWQNYSEKGLSRSQIFALDKIEEEGPQNVASLAEALRMTSGAVTGISDKLVVEGYAVRKRDEVDRRVVYLDITEKGRNELQSLIAMRRRFIENIIVGLPDEDLRHLRRIFGHILNNLEGSRKE